MTDFKQEYDEYYDYQKDSGNKHPMSFKKYKQLRMRDLKKFEKHENILPKRNRP